MDGPFARAGSITVGTDGRLGRTLDAPVAIAAERWMQSKRAAAGLALRTHRQQTHAG